MTCDRCPISLLCLSGQLRLVHCPNCDAVTLGYNDVHGITYLTTVRCYACAQLHHDVNDISVHTAEHGCYRCQPIANTNDRLRTGGRMIHHVQLLDGNAVFAIQHAYWCTHARLWQQRDLDEPPVVVPP